MNTSPRHGAASLRIQALDGHTRLFLTMIKGGIRKWKANLPTVDRVRPPHRFGPMPLKELPFGSGATRLRLPVEDEDWPPADLQRRILLRLLRSGRLFPIRDFPEAWTCPQEARDTFEAVLPLGALLSRPYHHWQEMASDAAMSRLAFAGLGVLRLEPYRATADDPPFLEPVRWMSDLHFLRRYAVREGFERYGARACFDADQRVVAIFWSHAQRWVRPGEPDWEHAKWVWKCSLMIATTLVDHLVGAHWVLGNYVTTAARTWLTPTHWLRLLLKPFTWRTVTINANALNSLGPERAFVHRASAFTWPALQDAFSDAVGLLRFETVPQMIARKGAERLVAEHPDSYPWLADALALYTIFHAFVQDYVARYATPEAIDADLEIRAFWNHLNSAPATLRLPSWSPAALVDVLAQFLWMVTGFHEAVGTVIEYVLDPTWMSTKIRPGTEVADIQTSMQVLLVTALTGLEMPRLLDLGDASEIFGADARGRAAFRRLHEDLVAFSGRLNRANARRTWPCDTFNPAHLEAGLSI